MIGCIMLVCKQCYNAVRTANKPCRMYYPTTSHCTYVWRAICHHNASICGRTTCPGLNHTPNVIITITIAVLRTIVCLTVFALGYKYPGKIQLSPCMIVTLMFCQYLGTQDLWFSDKKPVVGTQNFNETISYKVKHGSILKLLFIIK